jgi:hypothetical protein
MSRLSSRAGGASPKARWLTTVETLRTHSLEPDPNRPTSNWVILGESLSLSVLHFLRVKRNLSLTNNHSGQLLFFSSAPLENGKAVGVQVQLTQSTDNVPEIREGGGNRALAHGRYQKAENSMCPILGLLAGLAHSLGDGLSY